MIFVVLCEPPYTERYVRWCEGTVDKLIIYLLLDFLKDDPDELNNLAADPDYQDIRSELTNKILEDWNPEKVQTQMDEKRKQIRLISEWSEIPSLKISIVGN